MSTPLRQLLAHLVLTGCFVFTGARTALAQDATPVSVPLQAGARIEVVGFGSSQTLAAGGVMQLILWPSIPMEGFAYESGLDLAATPVGEVRPAEPAMMPIVSDEQVIEVIKALELSGLGKEAVAFSTGTASAIGSMFGAGSAVIAVDLDTTQLTEVDAIVALTQTAAIAVGLSLGQVSVAYRVEDCRGAERDAVMAAIEDSRTQATAIADLVGAELHEMISLSKEPSFSPALPRSYGLGGLCDHDLTIEDAFSTYFEPASLINGMVTVYAQVRIAFSVR